MAKNSNRFYGTGRRKSSIARVYLVPGTGKVTINKKDMDEYFGLDTLKLIVKQPFAATGTEGKFDVLVNVKGGGFTGQAGAIRHGISRALLEADAEYRPALKNLQGLQKLWNVAKWVGNYIVCNTYATGMQQIYQ